MPQNKTLTIASVNSSRRHVDTGNGQGLGGYSHGFVGRYGSFDYKSYLKPTMDWTSVGKIVSATLRLYFDDNAGTWATPTGKVGKTVARLLTASFSEGSGTSWVSDYYIAPAASYSGQVFAYPGPFVANDLIEIDITEIMGEWAPTTVARADGRPGGARTVNGIALLGYSDADQRFSFWTDDAAAQYRPTIYLEYEYAPINPSTPTNLSPSGAQASLSSFQGDFVDTNTSDTLAASRVQLATGDATAVGDTYLTGTLLYDETHPASAAEIAAVRFSHVPSGSFPALDRNTNYTWRAKVRDAEGRWSNNWTALTTFSVSNTVPVAPVADPADAASFDNPDGVIFRGGTFSDPDDDSLLAYQVQMSAYPAGAQWDVPSNILWDTGKTYVAAGSTDWQAKYGGSSLASGTYYWRSRHWDQYDGVSAWTYASIVFTSSFDATPGSEKTQQRVMPKWRVVIYDMAADRGRNNVVAIFENAKGIGASKMYNSAGEFHFTLLNDDPQISVVEPRQTHYAVEFYSGDGWREKFAGLIIDYSANENDVVFKGIDYLGLFGQVHDENYDITNPNLPAEKGGSYYVTTGKNTISYIIDDQLDRAIALTDSIVGFITVGTVESMTETVALYSTMQPCLPFVAGLLESHKAGTGKKSRISVDGDGAGNFTVNVLDNPGQARDNLILRYGETVNSYEVVPFGDQWRSRTHGIGRTRDGIKVLYATAAGQGIDESVWGRWSVVEIMDGVSDDSDLQRRVKQSASKFSRLGRHVAIGLNPDLFHPFDGYDIMDKFQIDINNGPIDTTAWGSGYWDVFGVTWELGEDGDERIIITFLPTEDSASPNPDLLTLSPINPQAEWQIGWTDPNPLNATSKYWLDQSSGIVYERDVDAITTQAVTGAAATDLFTAAGHGFNAGDGVYFALMTGGAGITPNALYYVIASGLTTDDFKVSETLGGASIDFTSNLTAGIVGTWPTYAAVNSTAMPELPTLAPPSIASVSSEVGSDSDGTHPVRVIVTVVHSTTPGVSGAVVELTTVAGPTWTNASVLRVPLTGTKVVFEPVPGATTYYVRAAAEDVYGRVSAYSSTTSDTSASDPDAPSVPTGLAGTNAVRGFLASWNAVADLDLSHYQLAYAQDDGSGTGPGANPFTVVDYKSTMAFIIVAADKWWFKVRAVDMSGNASSYTSTTSATARLVETTDVKASAITTTEIADDAITTPKIYTGAVTAGQLGVVSGLGSNLIMDAAWEWYKSGVTDYWAIAGDFGINIVGVGTTFRYHTYRGHLNGAGVNTTNELWIGSTNAADSGCIAVNAGAQDYTFTVLQGLTASGGTYRIRLHEYNSSFTLITSTTLESFTTNQTFPTTSVYRLKTNATTGDSYVTYAATFDTNTRYIRFSFDSNGAAVTGDWYILATNFGTGLVPALPQPLPFDGSYVYVDPGGVLIKDGKLALTDEYDSTVATGSGFEGGWAEQIRLGLYNGNFLRGTVGSLSSGRTSALPFWEVALDASASAAFLSGGGVSCTWSAITNDTSFYSDLVPCTPLTWYELDYIFTSNVAAGNTYIQPYISWYDKDQTYISSAVLANETVSSTISSKTAGTPDAALAPSTAAFMSVELTAQEQSSHSASNNVKFYGASIRQVGSIGPQLPRKSDSQVKAVTPASGTTNNWNLGGSGYVNTYDTFRLANFGNRALITGIVAPEQTKRQIELFVYDLTSFTLAHDNSGSSAGNKIYCPGEEDLILENGDWVKLWYNDADSYWWVEAVSRKRNNQYLLNSTSGTQTTTVTTAGSYYIINGGGLYLTFTSQAVGQRFLIVGDINAYADTAGYTTMVWRVETTGGSPITSLGYTRHGNAGTTTSYYGNHAIAYVWTSDRTGDVIFRPSISHTVNGTVVTTAFYNWTVIAIN